MLTGHYYYNGKFVMLDHGNGLVSIFLHMDDIHVSKGNVIKKDHVIGTVGILDCQLDHIYIGQ